MPSPGVIIIRPPYTPRDCDAPTLHSAFNLLGISKRASLVCNLGDDAGEFSKPVTGGGVWNAKEGYATLYLKAPGTDIYLPRELAQFEKTIRKIIDYNYGSGKTGPENRDGSEWCHLIVTQRMEYPKTQGSPGYPPLHLDMHADEVVKKGKWYNDERYVVSDTEKMGTIFLDTDTDLKQEDLLPREKDHWERKLREIFESKVSTARKFQPYDIAHFNTTTPHQRENPTEPVMRTFLTLGFGHGYAPMGLDQINNPYLLQAMEARQNLAAYKMREDLLRSI